MSKSRGQSPARRERRNLKIDGVYVNRVFTEAIYGLLSDARKKK